MKLTAACFPILVLVSLAGFAQQTPVPVVSQPDTTTVTQTPIGSAPQQDPATSHAPAAVAPVQQNPTSGVPVQRPAHVETRGDVRIEMRTKPLESSVVGATSSLGCDALIARITSSAKAKDDRLAQLVTEMNEAPDREKTDRMAAVITELVAQRKQMRDEMIGLMPLVSVHVLQHFQSGMMTGVNQSLAACPLLNAAPRVTTVGSR